MLKIAICDKKREDSERIYQYIDQYCKNQRIEAEIFLFDHPDVLLTECEKILPQIYVLEIVLPMVNGIQAAREIRWNQPDAQIIFVTAESSYALESFDVNPINYLLKPLDLGKLCKTLDLAIRKTELEDDSAVVKVRGGYETIHLNEILYIDYRNHVVTYHLRNRKQVVTTTMRIGFAEYLRINHTQSGILQCHESVAVNIGAIIKLSHTGIVVQGGDVIPVAGSRYASILNVYLDYYKRTSRRYSAWIPKDA